MRADRPDNVKRAAEFKAAGLSRAQIADRLRVSPAAASRLLKRAEDLEAKQQRRPASEATMSPQRQAKARRALELREQGLENEAIAERLGVSRNYIAQLLKALSRLEG